MCRGCEAWIVREGYEGLVRGNTDAEPLSSHQLSTTLDVDIRDPTFITNLRFGDGALLRDGTGDHTGGRTLKGRYIVRVGWDDVRGWFAQVRTLSRPYVICYPSTLNVVSHVGRHAHRYRTFENVPNPRGPPYRRI
jgi:hypothetical protein